MIKGIIFDIDGVVLDSMSIWNDLGARYLRSLNVEPEEGLNEILFSMSMEQGADYLKEHYKLKRSTASILNGIQDMLRDFYYYEVPAKPGAKELMEFLKEKGMRITAATSSPRSHIEKALTRNKLLRYVEVIYTTGEIGISKHSPDIYNKAASYMKLAPAEVLVLEDSLYALKTAKEAGYKTAGVYDKDGETDQAGVEATGDIYIKSLHELIEHWTELY
ncbi:MAG: HAD family phosphatase [Eubacterium sp.]|nr:HAD family phosphatase [Eubacterium sp.]